MPVGGECQLFPMEKKEQKSTRQQAAIHVIRMRQFSYVLVKQFADMYTVVTKVFDKTMNGAFIK